MLAFLKPTAPNAKPKAAADKSERKQEENGKKSSQSSKTAEPAQKKLFSFLGMTEPAPAKSENKKRKQAPAEDSEKQQKKKGKTDKHEPKPVEQPPAQHDEPFITPPRRSSRSRAGSRVDYKEKDEDDLSSSPSSTSSSSPVSSSSRMAVDSDSASEGKSESEGRGDGESESEGSSKKKGRRSQKATEQQMAIPPTLLSAARSPNVCKEVLMRGQSYSSPQPSFTKLPAAVLARSSQSLERVSCRNRFLAGGDWQAYAVDVSRDGSLLAAGGKGGVVKLFARRPEQVVDSIADEDIVVSPHASDFDQPASTMSAHARWVSAVQFARASGGDGHLLLSSADDGAVCLWQSTDLIRGGEHAGEPVQRLTSDDLHGGEGKEAGIFSMHVHERRVLTACKDSTIIMHAMRSDRLQPRERTFAGHHSQVVKSVHWRDDSVFASTGNDRLVNVFDIRASQPLVCTIPELHSLAANTVRWRPHCEHALFSSGFDKHIVMSDIRRPTRSLFTMHQHWPAKLSRASSIHHPCFFADGLFVLASAAANHLFAYDSSTGRLVAHVPLGFNPTQLAPFPDPRSSNRLLVYGKRHMFVLDVRVNEM